VVAARLGIRQVSDGPSAWCTPQWQPAAPPDMLVALTRGGLPMRYEKPEFVEIKMDAEIGAYQNDFDPVPVVEQAEEAADAE
jgi:hypothetical protein